MKRVVIVFFFLAAPALLLAQELDQKKFDDLLKVEIARRFPYTGKLDLGESEPNPLKSSAMATISYRAVDAFAASIVFYDMAGKKVLAFERLPEDAGAITIPGDQLPAGTYVYAFIVNGRVIDRKKMMVAN